MKAARRFAIVLLFPILLSYQTLTARDQPRATLAEALTLYQHGNFDAAADMYREILKLDSKNSDAYAGLTRTLLKQRKLECTAAGEVDFR